MQDQFEKGRVFRSLHEQNTPFIVPNPWDIGSARLLEAIGFRALATTSSGFAASIGLRDGEPGRDAVLGHVRALALATQIPITGDLENGFGDSPEHVADTIRRAADAGLVGGSIEDFTGRAQEPLYEISYAKERIVAAAEAARALAFPFTLTARAENLLKANADLSETIRRLQAYQEAGADVLFAPGLRTVEQIRTVLREVDRPLNVLASGLDLSVADLGALGVRRISVGGLLAHVAYGALIHAARELKDAGTFGFSAEASRARDLRSLMARKAP